MTVASNDTDTTQHTEAVFMNAPTPAGPQPEDRGLQPPDFGQPSPALIARADRGYARFLATHTPHATTGDHDHDQDDNAADTR
ncbi:hypothetical protein ACGFR6_27900 [Streptomyces sp. NPDC048567]|uniref:hypothetical protein n=1 Tax=Streptomyces sp. NPDC048567 TaxID=3365570 RepID=UPI0037118D0C